VLAYHPSDLNLREQEVTMSNASDLYLEFVCNRRSLRERNLLPPLDPLEERLLEIIAGTTESEIRLSVTDLNSNSDLGSPTTLHNRLTSLRNKGWVELAYAGDARRRHVQLSTAGLRYLDTLAKYIINSVA